MSTAGSSAPLLNSAIISHVVVIQEPEIFLWIIKPLARRCWTGGSLTLIASASITAHGKWNLMFQKPLKPSHARVLSAELRPNFLVAFQEFRWSKMRRIFEPTLSSCMHQMTVKLQILGNSMNGGNYAFFMLTEAVRSPLT